MASKGIRNQVFQANLFSEQNASQVLVVGLASRAEVGEEMARLARLFSRLTQVRCVSLEEEPRLDSMTMDLVVVVGGDGSILRTARLLGESQVPMIGVNLGRLGFLTALQTSEVEGWIEDVRRGAYGVVSHLMLRAQLFEGENLIFQDLIINEIAVRAGPPFCILELNLYVDQEWVTTYSSDGLILSTPVGSTAHSLSAGGPILRKDLDAVVITPLSPHTLTNRPVVDSSSRTYSLTLAGEEHGATGPSRCSQTAAIVVDGREAGELTPGRTLKVVDSGSRLLLVATPGHEYYQTLREKLRWGGSVRKP